MKVERIRNATVVSPDAADARKTFQDLFGLAAAGPGALAVGESRIEFLTPADGTRLADALVSRGEGMAEICLRVASLSDAAASLRTAGVAFDEEAGAIHVDPAAAHGVRLTRRDAD